MIVVREFNVEEQLCCVHGHPFPRLEEPVEHDLITCPFLHNRGHSTQHSCEARAWVLQLEGGRRLAVAVSARSAEEIKRRRMTPAGILDMLGLISQKAS